MYLISKHFILFIILFFLNGCGDLLQSKKYTSTFLLNKAIALDVELFDPNEVKLLFQKYGIVCDTQSSLHVKLTTDPLKSSCPINTSHIVKEHFIRISIYENNEEHYRIQLNQKEPIALKDIEKVIARMKKEVGK